MHSPRSRRSPRGSRSSQLGEHAALLEPTSTFQLRLVRKVGQGLGLGVNRSTSHSFLVATRLEAGPVRAVNAGRAPAERLAVGDIIVSINEEKGTDKMMALLLNSGTVELNIAFKKSTGRQLSDYPELRDELQRALPEYRIGWSGVTMAVLEYQEAGGLLTQGLQHTFQAKLLRSGTLELIDPKPLRKNARREKEFARVSTLTTLIGERELLRRQEREQASTPTPATPPPLPIWTPQVGDAVEGRYISGRFYKATVAEDHGDGYYTLKWADGDCTDCVKALSDLRQPQPGEDYSPRAHSWEAPQRLVEEQSPKQSLPTPCSPPPVIVMSPRCAQAVGPEASAPESPPESTMNSRAMEILQEDVAQIVSRHGDAVSPPRETTGSAFSESQYSALTAQTRNDDFAFVGRVGNNPGSRPGGKFTQPMKALAESHRNGDLTEEEFQCQAASVFGWELAVV